MKLAISIFAALLLVAALAAAADPSGSAKPTAGLREYTDTFKVQQPYDLKVADREQTVRRARTNGNDEILGRRLSNPGASSGRRLFT